MTTLGRVEQGRRRYTLVVVPCPVYTLSLYHHRTHPGYTTSSYCTAVHAPLKAARSGSPANPGVVRTARYRHRCYRGWSAGRPEQFLKAGKPNPARRPGRTPRVHRRSSSGLRQLSPFCAKRSFWSFWLFLGLVLGHTPEESEPGGHSEELNSKSPESHFGD